MVNLEDFKVELQSSAEYGAGEDDTVSTMRVSQIALTLAEAIEDLQEQIAALKA